jgi:tetratricopeptide (TPR) repeat protein
MILRRSEESVQQAKLGLELDPLKPLALVLYGNVMVNEGDYQSAIQHFEKALSKDPNFGLAAGYLSQVQLDLFYRNGDYEKWIELWEKNRARGLWNEEGITTVLNTFHEEGHIAAIEEMFKMNEKYGDSCYMHDLVKEERYLKLKDYDKVMDILEKRYEMKTITANVALNKYYNVLKDTPRYIELLKKMNLPHDD